MLSSGGAVLAELLVLTRYSSLQKPIPRFLKNGVSYGWTRIGAIGVIFFTPGIKYKYLKLPAEIFWYQSPAFGISYSWCGGVVSREYTYKLFRWVFNGGPPIHTISSDPCTI